MAAARRRGPPRSRSSSPGSTFRLRLRARRRRRSPSCSPRCCIRSRPATAASRKPGADLHATLTVPFSTALRGVQRQVVVTRQESCPACRGSRARQGTTEGRCAQCQHRQRALGARAHGVLEAAAPRAAGPGASASSGAGSAAAQGRVVRSEAITSVRAAGHRRRRRGCGSPSTGTRARHGGRTGDLYVAVHVTAASAAAPRGGRRAHAGAGGGPRSGARHAHRAADLRRYRAGCGCRRARRRGSGSGSAAAACRQRVRRAAAI